MTLGAIEPGSGCESADPERLVDHTGAPSPEPPPQSPLSCLDTLTIDQLRIHGHTLYPMTRAVRGSRWSFGVRQCGVDGTTVVVVVMVEHW